MAKQIILLLVFNLCFQNFTFAEDRASAGDRIIGSTFKALAKAFVATADINRLKKNNIEKINKMNEEKFRKRYSGVYKIIKDLPVKLKVSYGITEAMSKGQAIRDIELLDKKKIYESIDSIPDTIIASQFKQYLSNKGHEIRKSSIVEQINNFWNKIMEKVNRAPTVSKQTSSLGLNLVFV